MEPMGSQSVWKGFPQEPLARNLDLPQTGRQMQAIRQYVDCQESNGKLHRTIWGTGSECLARFVPASSGQVFVRQRQVFVGFPKTPSIQIPTLVSKVYKQYLLWAIWSLRGVCGFVNFTSSCVNWLCTDAQKVLFGYINLIQPETPALSVTL